jgi:Bacterial Ig-like domain/Periplasmic copper-binding protein (NosD)
LRHLDFGLHGRTRTLAILLAMLLAATILGVAPQVSAAGPICGAGKVYRSGSIAVSQTWDATSTQIMKGNVTILSGATLTINPGVCVLADPSVRLYVGLRGTLRADGISASMISFDANRSAPWGGIQFNSSAFGSVSWSTFDHVDRAVTVLGPSTSPTIHDNTVVQAGLGFAFLQGSTGDITGNTIRRATSFGVYVNASTVQVTNNKINNTPVAIQLEQPQLSTVSGNTITNVSSAFAIGISVWYGATATIFGNTIQSVRGAAGVDAATSGANGRDGGSAIGVFVNGAPSADISFNSLDIILGGNAGSGAGNTSVGGGPGGRGGKGGGAGGIIVAGTPSVSIFGNDISSLIGGRGGAGGQGGTTNTGGRGGDAGEAIGIEIFSAKTSSTASFNAIIGLTGGVGGTGGAGTARDGAGGAGGDTNGLLFLAAAQLDTSANTARTLRGGYGGNTTGVVSIRNGNGGRGGDANGISAISVISSATVHSNTIDTLAGGIGGRGLAGGHGGNVTGVLDIGNNDRLFNATSISSNFIVTLNGGLGGLGRSPGGDGGSATGIGVVFVTPSLASNTLWVLQGGRGGDGAGVGGVAGRGGDAQGVVGALVSNGLSSLDSILSVTKGAAGAGAATQPSYALGFQFIGNATYTSRFTVDNGTFSSVGSYEFFVNNYTRAVSVNTPFTKVAVMNAGNLTVRNYLDVQALWPNGLTLVANARVIVQDNGVDVWNRTATTGDQPWILVTDRVYVNKNLATDNVTNTRVTYAAHTFVNSPRSVNMATSHVELFTMVDIDPPTSSASPLSTYKNSTSFFVYYTASDGNGKGLGNITLWYRQGESMVWIKFVTQAAATSGSFAFVATSNGHYEFATTADDLAGNKQPGPSSNNTWTLIDTLAPGSHVNPLTAYKNSMSFTVTWAPDVGVTDISTYTIQYNSNSGWVNWIVGTTTTSATFTAPAEGVYAFRSIAIDRAGNWEVAPSGNDTWTIVDVTRPTVTSFVPTVTNATTSPIIRISFSKPMDRASVERAFSISGGMNGTFQWSSDSRSVTFLPSGALQAGTTYTVVLATTATDLAGNQMLNPLTYQFSTAAAPPTGLALSTFWWLLPILAAIVGAALFLIMRRRSAAAPRPVAPTPAPVGPKAKEAIIEDLFLLNHRDGLLIKHETRRLRPDVDTDILTGMLTAVQQFVKDALRGDDYADLNEMTVGQMHILIGRGKWLVLAARIEGDGTQPWTASIERCIKDMEDHHWDQLEDWDGDMAIARTLTPYLKKLIDGAYSAPTA